MKWISVKDKLPEAGDSVFLYSFLGGGEFAMGHFTGEHHKGVPLFDTYGCPFVGWNRVTHWAVPTKPEE